MGLAEAVPERVGVFVPVPEAPVDSDAVTLCVTVLEGEAVLLGEAVMLPDTVVVEVKEAVAVAVTVGVPLGVDNCVGAAVDAAERDEEAVVVDVDERDSVVEAVTVGDEVNRAVRLDEEEPVCVPVFVRLNEDVVVADDVLLPLGVEDAVFVAVIVSVPAAVVDAVGV